MPVQVPADIAERDSERLAAAAGLDHVTDDDPGYRRTRRGRGFSYIGPDGTRAANGERERLHGLAVPPAWEDVWYSIPPDGHLLATGRDAATRKQYRYHDRFREFCDQLKFRRMTYFPKALVALRRQVSADLDGGKGDASFAIAAAVRLMDLGHLRVGNDRSADLGHFGATTLSPDHLRSGEDGCLVLDFVGKGGSEREVSIESRRFCRVLSSLAELDDERLFVWFDEERNELRPVDATDVNRYIEDVAGPAFSAKDFRTWAGTVTAGTVIAKGGDEVAAINAAADALGNTRAVARSSYVHPLILDENCGLDLAWKSSRTGTWLNREESAVAKVLRAQRGAR